MHRLVPSRYSEGESLRKVAGSEALLIETTELAELTSERRRSRSFGTAGISNEELPYGIPNSAIVRAAYLYASESGGRFNGPTRGAWYAAMAIETSIAEVTYHLARRLKDIIEDDGDAASPHHGTFFFDDWLADFHAEFHTLDSTRAYKRYLKAEPVPQCYGDSQLMADRLLHQRSLGIIYPSVRHPGGICLACFRPALVYRPRLGTRYGIGMTRHGDGYQSSVAPVARV
jgi:RES domain-containing protein